MIQNSISRLWFLSHGCKQVPLEHAKNIVRWAHPDGYFLKPNGQKAKDTFSPSQYTHKGGSCYPRLRECVNACHILMAYAFYGERPTYVNAKGELKPYQSHHLNGDKFDYRPANILAWIHPDIHRIADRRQRALRELVPDLHAFPYERLRTLQDPRITTDEQFAFELEQLRPGFKIVDPLILNDLELTKHYDPFVEKN